MVYGLTCLYRLSDFIKIADAHNASVVVFTAYWAEQREKTAYVQGEDRARSESWFVDCYELGFMGAFGIGYKIIIKGQQHVAWGSVLDNQELAKQSRVVQDAVLAKWSQMSAHQRMQRKDFTVCPGVLFEVALVDVLTIDIESFLKGNVPERAVILLGNQRSNK